jgi:predicted DNA-binding transcriptional regulator YafY
MNRTERFYRTNNLLRGTSTVSTATLLHELEVSRATLHRDLEYMCDRMDVPIIYDHAKRGYRIDSPTSDGVGHELPGLWFNSRELHALLTFHHFLDNLEPGLLSPHIAPLKARIQASLGSKEKTLAEVSARIRILPQAVRYSEPTCFQLAAHTLLARKQMRFRYHSRGRDDITERAVSPQRLVHYRDNWYLDAWDHGKRALRTFALERIREPLELKEDARDISEKYLDRHFSESYGIFSGRPRRKAVLRFSPQRTRWVADEIWHPQQKGWFEGDRYCLEIPYSDDRELVLDILKHGPEVEVLQPTSLRNTVFEQLLRAESQYRK